MSDERTVTDVLQEAWDRMADGDSNRKAGDVIELKWISVTERLPEPDRNQRHFVLTDEGAVWLMTYDPPRNAKRGDPTSWYDDMNDSGYVIAWAEFHKPAGAFSPLLKAWQAARGDD